MAKSANQLLRQLTNLNARLLTLGFYLEFLNIDLTPCYSR